jgi:hypothetical protein
VERLHQKGQEEDRHLLPGFIPWPTGSVLAVAPDCVYPSMVTGLVIASRLEATTMACTPLPVMLNVIVSPPVFALALKIAWRNEPAPESFVFVTVYVFARALAATARPRRGSR